MMSNVKESKDFLEAKLAGFKPEVAIVVGSGLGGVSSGIASPAVVPYTEIPHFPKPTVSGHAGQMIFGELAGKKLMVLSGRFHFYEGRSLAEITYPIHVVDALGVKILLVTNAAGGINPSFNPGDLMIIEDHINLMGVNPLIGGNGNGGIKFIDMTQAYSTRLREKLEAAAEKLQQPIRRGVYLATIGPSYETPAEIKAFAWIGADAVGMSTVPEVIMARHHNIEVAGLSCITNLAAGITTKKLSHEEVLEVGNGAQTKLAKLLAEFLAML
ncbi:MAG TPA: purine-nucleoside phosphorylase [Verrucomicrobiae bacterium]|nr:purine-nucleoside phosphorylase [Verrucomicrobiae bacterium]